MHSPNLKLICLKQGTEVGLCISGIYGKIYLFKSVLTCYICTTDIVQGHCIIIVTLAILG